MKNIDSILIRHPGQDGRDGFFYYTMQFRYLLRAISSLFLTTLHAQKHDYNWVMGYEYNSPDPFGNMRIDFKYRPPKVFKENLRMNFNTTSGTCSDSMGNLLFYTNGLRISAQHHYPDEWWPMGVTKLSDTTSNGNAWLHFHNNIVTMESADLQMNFEATSGIATDTAGRALFYSNGCEIRGSNGNLLENGDDINPGVLHEWVCANGYVLPRSMLTLQQPGSASKWILLHMGGRYDPIRKFVYETFYSSVVDMAANGSLGKVVNKNNVLESGELEPFSLVRHGNGRDWWLVIPEYGTNRYHVRLIDPTGISNETIQVFSLGH